MKIKVITVGKTRERFWRLAEAEYVQRLGRYADVQTVAVKPASLASLKDEAEVMKQEAEAIAAKLDPQEFVVALDAGGRSFTSEGLAEWLSQKMVHGTSRLAFVVGGPLGLPEDFLQRADLRLALSKMTLPHEMAEVVLLEQLYRAFTILRGEKYHK